MATTRVGPVKLDNETRAQITLTVTTSFDPTDSTVELGIDDAWYDATWTAAAVESDGKWTRQALTDDHFAGPDAGAVVGIVLTSGRHLTQTRVTSSVGEVVAPSTPIDVT